MCAAETSFTKRTKVLTCGSVVIFHLERFSYLDIIAICNLCIVDCSDDLTQFLLLWTTLFVFPSETNTLLWLQSIIQGRCPMAITPPL